MVHDIQIVFILLLVFIIGFGTLAERLQIPYPIVLVIGGLLLSFVPGLPQISLDPDFVFLAVLPPLLFSAAAQTSWRDFQRNLVAILSLAFGLVGFTVLGVSLAAHWLIPGFDWRLGLVLGAALAPTDAIAATAIAQRVGLPKRIVDVLEGESLVNDASGLLALEFSTALVVSGEVPSFAEGIFRLLYLVAGGIAIGWLTGRIVRLLEKHVDNAPIEVTVSIVTPYVAYMGAEAVHASGVLAAVTAGLYLGRRISDLFSSRVRIEARSFWNTLSFLLNGIVFLLIGLQLPYILHGIRSVTPRELFTSAAELAVSIVLLRLIWVFPGAYVSYFIARRWLHQTVERPPLRAVFVVGWTGMRGVVSLAAALALPAVLSNGQPFPQRSVFIFLTFSVILVTLVLQGLTLPSLIRALHLSESKRRDPDEQKGRRVMLEAAVKYLEDMHPPDDSQLNSAYETLAQLYRHRLTLAQREATAPEHDSSAGDRKRYRSIARKVREVERSALMDMRNRKEIGDAALRTLERELDLLDVSFASE